MRIRSTASADTHLAPTMAAPAVRRHSGVHWRDLRMWAGLALVLVSVLVGALIVGGQGQTATVWQARESLSAGHPLTSDDLVTRVVPVDVAGLGYLPATAPPSGVLAHSLTAGQLVPVAAIAAPDQVPLREVTVAVDPERAPIGLAAGERVDVWVTPHDDGDAMALEEGVGAMPPAVRLTSQALASARVVDVSDGTTGLGGKRAVALELPEANVADFMAALHASDVDLVRVPMSQAAPPDALT